MIRLVQLQHRRQGRRIALVEGNQLRLLNSSRSIYALAQVAITAEKSLREIISKKSFRENA